MGIFGGVETPRSGAGDGEGGDRREAVPGSKDSDGGAKGGVGQGGGAGPIVRDQCAGGGGEAPRDRNHEDVAEPKVREEISVGGSSRKCESKDEDVGDTADDARLAEQGVGFATPKSDEISRRIGNDGEECNGRIMVETGCAQGVKNVVLDAPEDCRRARGGDHRGGGAMAGAAASGADANPESVSSVGPTSEESDTHKELDNLAERTTGQENTASLHENEPSHAPETATSSEEADGTLTPPPAPGDSPASQEPPPPASPLASAPISSADDTQATMRTQPTGGGRGLAPLKIPTVPEACDSRVPRMKEAEYLQRRAAGMPRSRSRRLRSRGRGLRMERPPGKAPEESPHDFLEILGLMKVKLPRAHASRPIAPSPRLIPSRGGSRSQRALV